MNCLFWLSRGLSVGVLLAASTVGVVACSGGDDNSPGASGGSGGASGASGGSGGASGVSLSDLGPQLISALCESQMTCAGPLSEMLGTIDDCKTQQLARYNEAAWPGIQTSVEEGKAKYDSSKANTCLTAIKALGCSFQETRLLDLPSCKGLLVGNSASGADCSLDLECSEGLYCKVASACPGKCSPYEAKGSACVKDDNCQSGLVCHMVQGKRACVEPVAAGAACGNTTPGCVAGTLCIGATEGKLGVCKSFAEAFSAAPGAACDLSTFELCQPGQVCQLDKLDQTGMISVCAAKAASGAACKMALPEACPIGEYCDGLDFNAAPPVMEGTCKKIPGEGEACAETSNGGCANGLFCSADKKCEALKKNGSACSGDQNCLSGHCEGGVCVAEDACNTK